MHDHSVPLPDYCSKNFHITPDLLFYTATSLIKIRSAVVHIFIALIEFLKVFFNIFENKGDGTFN